MYHLNNIICREEMWLDNTINYLAMWTKVNLFT